MYCCSKEQFTRVIHQYITTDHFWRSNTIPLTTFWGENCFIIYCIAVKNLLKVQISYQNTYWGEIFQLSNLQFVKRSSFQGGIWKFILKVVILVLKKKFVCNFIVWLTRSFIKHVACFIYSHRWENIGVYSVIHRGWRAYSVIHHGWRSRTLQEMIQQLLEEILS